MTTLTNQRYNGYSVIQNGRHRSISRGRRGARQSRGHRSKSQDRRLTAATGFSDETSSDNDSVHRYNSHSSRQSRCDVYEGRFLELKVFKFLVKTTGGCISVATFKERFEPLPQNLDEWLNEQRERISVYKRNHAILYVGPFLKNATVCTENFGFGEDWGCRRLSCKRFHICKYYLNGFCKLGSRCRKGHDFENTHNSEIKEKLGLKEYTDEEMKMIILWRYPQVCQARKCSLTEDCPYLHICYNFLIDKCDDPSCPRVHSFDTLHNKWVLSVYRMERWPTQKLALLKSLVNMPRSQRTICRLTLSDLHTGDQNDNFGKSYSVRLDRTNQNTLCQISSLEHQIDVFKKKASSTTSSVADKDADKKEICLSGLSGACQEKDCDKHHTRLTYLWQVRLHGDWISFDDDENQKLERHYYNLEDTADGEVGVLWKKERIRLHFAKGYGTTGKPIEPLRLDIRRLSSVSFVIHGSTLDSGSFRTQWRWYFQNDFGKWIPYEKDEVQYTLEKKYIMKQKSYLFTRESHKTKYKIEFSDMRQINTDTSKVRNILRRPVFVSLADVVSNSFPRPLHVSIPESYPSGWDSIDVSDDFEWVDLEEISKEFKEVQASFFKTLSEEQFKISNIYRIQNLALWNEYNMKKSIMERAGGKKAYNVNERSLFHGTDSIDTCFGICTNNFDFRLCGKNATAYGKGSYFAVSAKYSNNYTRGTTRFMFKAKVLIGNYTKGDQDMTCPPIIPGEGHKRYDSCVDNVLSPSIFVIFDRNQSYPEYIIAYKENIESKSLDTPLLRRANRSLSRRRASRSVNVNANINNAQNYSNTLQNQRASSQQSSNTTSFTNIIPRSPSPHPRGISSLRVSNGPSTFNSSSNTSTRFPTDISNTTATRSQTHSSTSSYASPSSTHPSPVSTGKEFSSTTKNYQASSGIGSSSTANNHQPSTGIGSSSTANGYQPSTGVGSSSTTNDHKSTVVISHYSQSYNSSANFSSSSDQRNKDPYMVSRSQCACVSSSPEYRYSPLSNHRRGSGCFCLIL